MCVVQTIKLGLEFCKLDLSIDRTLVTVNKEIDIPVSEIQLRQ